MTIETATAELATALEIRQRTNGTPYVAIRDGAADWILDAVQAAHGDMLPDDTRYGMIREIALDMAERADDLDDARNEIVDSVPSVYHGARYAWLASHNSRADYCDQAREEGLVAEDSSLSDRIAAGWYAEADEIYSALLEALQERADDE